ncbi:MAG TPA: ABC transporter ATP-binding protein [Gaiellaceae bacterium]|jgi:ABC-type multidrug transport system fused ATPase/permease subunit
MTRLRPFLLPHWPALAGAGAATVVLTLADLAAPWPLKLVVDRLIDRSGGGSFTLTTADAWFLAAVAGALVGISLASALADYSSAFWLNRAGERIVHDLRIAAYAHLQRLSLAFHERRPTGELVTRVTGDVNAVGSLFSDSLGAIASSLFVLVGMAVVSFWLDPWLGLAAFAVSPLLAYVSVRYRSRVKSLARQQRAEEGAIASLAAEALAAMDVVKAFGSEQFEYERVQRLSEARRELGVHVSRTQARFSGIVDVLGAVAGAVVLVLGTFRVAAGALTPGDLIVFAAYASKTYKPLRDIARQATAIARSLARAERVADVLASDELLPEAAAPRGSGRARGALVFDRVAFGYSADRPALRGVSLELEPGAQVAVVGESGAGKSTLAALVARFYDPTSGRVLIDDRDAREYSRTWLRAQVGFLLQDTVLFTGTVAENIAYAVDATREEVIGAARTAGAHDFVTALPEGYDTALGPRGVGLSGGQRQRIGIARVLLRNPPLLVLDEPTTGLDAATEAALLDELDALMDGRTTVVITHSLPLARRAGRVLVLDAGRLVEDGPPAELLARGGHFARLCSHGRVLEAIA